MMAIEKVEEEIDRLLEEATHSEQVQRFARHLRRERSALFTFLHYGRHSCDKLLFRAGSPPDRGEPNDVRR